MDLLITNEAHAHVANAARRGDREGREFGGSLLGVDSAAGPPIIVYAVPTGPAADQQYGYVRTDADYQNRTIARVRERYPALRYVGDWHVHPHGATELSGTDLATAEVLLRDPQLRLERLLLLLGIPVDSEHACVRGFRAQLRPGGVEAPSANLQVVERDDERIRLCLGDAPVSLSSLLSRPSRQADRVHPAEERITHELETLARRGISVAQLRQAGDLAGADVHRGRDRLWVLFPPEYPFGAPQVFRDGPGGLTCQVPLPFGWSSLHSLPDLLEEALDHRLPQKRMSRPPARPWIRVGASWLARWTQRRSNTRRACTAGQEIEPLEAP